jgi:N-succinyldiaminopimelate aminotransferase
VTDVATFPRLASAAESLPLSIFARLYERLARFTGDVVPLQIGDTYLLPAEKARLDAQPWTEIAARELYAYAPPGGWPPLVDAIVAKLARKNHLSVGAGGVQVTCGATHALACSVGAVLDPGDELVLLTPHWPLIKGIAQSRSVVPVEVPYTMRLAEEPGLDPVAVLEAAITPRTAAIYVSSPNNPDGIVLDERMLAAVVEVARRHDLWILSDEVYDEYVYDVPHVSIGSLPGAAARTITVFSFSKSYAQAGLRVGYAVGPEPVIAALRKMANHSVYNVPQAMQRAAHAALVGGDDFLAAARSRYRAARDLAHARLVAPSRLPAGSTYLFVDLRRYSPTSDCMGVLERIAEAGVLLAPGSAFGAMYDGYARLCFTAADPDRLVVGIDRINHVLDG